MHQCLFSLFIAAHVSTLALALVHQVGSQQARNTAAIRSLWTYWADGTPPDFVQLCLKTWERHAGRGWQLRVVSRKTAHNYVNASDLPEHFEYLQPSFQADALRLALLHRRGGAWIDASTIAVHDLPTWIDTEFDVGQKFVGFYIDHYTAPGGPPLVASWAMAVPRANQRLMAEWHAAYLRLWRNRTSEEGITDDPFFSGVDFARVDPLELDYLHIELVLLALLQRDSALRALLEDGATLFRAEDTAYGLQASMGLQWMALNKCAPVTTPFVALPPVARQSMQSTPLVKFRHEDRQWLVKMSSSQLLGSSTSVIGSLLGQSTADRRHHTAEDTCVDSELDDA